MCRSGASLIVLSRGYRARIMSSLVRYSSPRPSADSHKRVFGENGALTTTTSVLGFPNEADPRQCIGLIHAPVDGLYIQESSRLPP
jgi:hypothetical protein